MDLYFRLNPEVPWLSRQANQVLETLILPTDVGLEFGSGRSTCWFAQRMKHLTSVEHDTGWFERVTESIAAKKIQNVTFVNAAFSRGEDPEKSEYVRIADRFADGSLDFVLVDGMVRDYCALATLPKVAPGGVLVVDDIHGFLDVPTTAPYSRWKRGPLNDRWGAFVEAVSTWRFIHAAQGIKDTGIWICSPSTRRAARVGTSA